MRNARKQENILHTQGKNQTKPKHANKQNRECP